MQINRAIPVRQLARQRFRGLDFEGPWFDAVGMPELTGAWLVWGNSGNGKTRFALQLAKYMTGFCRVAYNSLEEGASLSFQRAVEQVDFSHAGSRLLVLDKEPINELIERLKRQKSPDVIIIDSVQYTGLKYAEYVQLKDQFRKKLFILVSHAEGKLPEGRVAKSIRYDAMVKVWIEGYMAFPVSRFGGGKPYTIWEEGAEEYHNSNAL
jgi:hypothetical protein